MCRMTSWRFPPIKSMRLSMNVAFSFAGFAESVACMPIVEVEVVEAGVTLIKAIYERLFVHKGKIGAQLQR